MYVISLQIIPPKPIQQTLLSGLLENVIYHSSMFRRSIVYQDSHMTRRPNTGSMTAHHLRHWSRKLRGSPFNFWGGGTRFCHGQITNYFFQLEMSFTPAPPSIVHEPGHPKGGHWYHKKVQIIIVIFDQVYVCTTHFCMIAVCI